MNKSIIYALLLLVSFSSYVSGQNDTVRITVPEKAQLPYTSIAKERVVGAIDIINGDLLRHSTEFNANAALSGLASGLYVFKYAGEPGSSGATFKVRGLSRGNSNDGPMIVVDGVPNRTLSDLSIESIESITVLKDVTAKMLYGSAAANGVIMVITKRGAIMKKKMSVSVESGMKTPVALPKFIGAADYAELYNKARLNDGLGVLYTPEAIDHYKNKTSPRKYPDEDYYGTFLNDQSNFTRVNTSLIGGDNSTKYYFNIEYINEGGLEAVGKQNQFNLLNLMSNLDYKVNKVVSMNLDISGRMGLRSSSNISSQSMFTAMSTSRPNDYPFFVGLIGNTDSLGRSARAEQTNLYGDLTRGGYVNSDTYRVQTNIGIKFDLNSYIKGLTSSVNLGFDAFNSIEMGKTLQYSSYNVIREDSLVKVGTDDVKGNEVKLSDDFFRNLALNANLNYSRDFENHSIMTNLVFSARSKSLKTTEIATGTVQDDKAVNVGLQVNYAYANKYVLEATSSLMGSDRFQRGNRYGVFGGAGAGWIISNEDFLSGSSVVNYLKLKGSYGVMGYDNSIGYYLYDNQYSSAGYYLFGVNNNSTSLDRNGYRISQLGNENLTFEKSKETNVGIETRLFKNSLTVEVNYFNRYRYDIPTVMDNSIPNYVSNVFPTANYNAISNQGVDVAIEYSKSIGNGDFAYSIGGNFMYAKSINEIYDEFNNYPHQNRTGKPTDAIFGWVYDGTYVDQADIDAYGVTSQYGKILPGDLKLKNITNDLGDNIIDTYDRTQIGHSFPLINYAVNVNLKYKGFEVYLVGQGVAQVDEMLNNNYYWNLGENKYSEQVLRSDYPRLTTSSTSHSLRNSSFWMVDGSYFKLRTAEISYQLPQSLLKKISIGQAKLYVSGTDLLSFSAIKELDIEDMNAGLTKYPMLKTVSLGLKVSF